MCSTNYMFDWKRMSVNQDTAMRRALIDKQTSLTHNIISSQTLYTNQQTPTAKRFLYMKNLKIMIFIIYCKVCSICSFSPRKPNLEIFSIYSNKFFHNFHLFESSFTCPGLRASGLAWRLHMSEMTFLSLLQQNILDVYQ